MEMGEKETTHFVELQTDDYINMVNIALEENELMELGLENKTDYTAEINRNFINDIKMSYTKK